jgi:hypothetical protein
VFEILPDREIGRLVKEDGEVVDAPGPKCGAADALAA